jgi:NADH-quinone oxidoreductase subunit A
MFLALPAAQYQPSDYLPILVQLGFALAFVAFAMIVSHLVGPNRKSAVKDSSFECGIESVGNARTPISVKYFLTAILFVLFDVEVIFMYPWAVNFRSLGTEGFCPNDCILNPAHGWLRVRHQKGRITLDRTLKGKLLRLG